MPGRLLLVPNTLDFGVAPAGAVPGLQETLPLGVIRAAAGLGHWVAENARTTRAFLKRVDAVVPLARPLQDISIVELPRPPKGRPAGTPDLAPLLGGSFLNQFIHKLDPATGTLTLTRVGGDPPAPPPAAAEAVRKKAGR